MKELIPMDDMGVMVSKSREEVMVDSRIVAEVFEKMHKNVVQDIEKLISMENTAEKDRLKSQPNYDDVDEAENKVTKSGLSADFVRQNFIRSSYKDTYGRTQICYLMTRDGFIVLAMGYTGKKAMAFKEAYIRRFNEMEAKLLQIQTLRDQHPFLTDAIKDTHENPQPYHYSNEADMLNRIVIGMTAKQFREQNHLEKGEPIRPHFNPDEAALMEYLQHVDAGFVYSITDFQQRKQKLEWCAMNWRRKRYGTMLIEKAGA